MNIKIENDERGVIVVLSGNIDIPAAEILKKQLFQVTEKNTKNVTLNFKQVESICSSGIGAIIFFHKNFNALGGKTKIINVNKEIRSLFSIIKLDNLIEISKT